MDLICHNNMLILKEEDIGYIYTNNNAYKYDITSLTEDTPPAVDMAEPIEKGNALKDAYSKIVNFFKVFFAGSREALSSFLSSLKGSVKVLGNVKNAILLSFVTTVLKMAGRHGENLEVDIPSLKSLVNNEISYAIFKDGVELMRVTLLKNITYSITVKISSSHDDVVIGFIRGKHGLYAHIKGAKCEEFIRGLMSNLVTLKQNIETMNAMYPHGTTDKNEKLEKHMVVPAVKDLFYFIMDFVKKEYAKISTK